MVGPDQGGCTSCIAFAHLPNHEEGLDRSKTRRRNRRPYFPKSETEGIVLDLQPCQEDRRALYAWKVNQGLRNVSPVGWHCRVCAGLSYASEGEALVIRRLLPELKPFRKVLRKPRPGPWEPLVFASPWDAMDAGLCQFNP
jgi:hypothetical protein